MFFLAVPFVLMLAAIAVLPLVTPHFWESNARKFVVASVLGAPAGIWFLLNDPIPLASAGLEYVSFMCLLGSLFVVSGGIRLNGDLRATPAVNTAFLAVGTVLASIAGTTGAAMLLIRPVLQTNSQRVHRTHTIVFFIFLIANCGGLLTPIGDPPLFMGYLRGVPFTWTLALWPQWLLVCGALLVLYYAVDTRMFAREPLAALELDRVRVEPLRLQGAANLAMLVAIVLTVAFGNRLPVFFHAGHASFGLRETLMIALGTLSLAGTSRRVRAENDFKLGPILEVAALFFGIFLTMIPALIALSTHGASFGLTHPAEYFWTTGVLSAFLDNAPTYIVFGEIAQSVAGVGSLTALPNDWLAAISCGAVFMGAATYIGNGPNFMVRAIAESAGVKMPSFFGYMAWSAAFLLPLMGLCTLLFFL